MLAVPAPFPQVGSFAFVQDTAERVRIIRTDPRAKTALLARDEACSASGNFWHEIALLHPTRDAALGLRRNASAAERIRAEAAAAAADRARA